MIRVAGKGLLATAAVLGGQLAWVIWRPLPEYQDLDPNGIEGDAEGPALRLVAVGDSSCTGSGLDDASDIWLRVLARRIAATGRRVEVASFAVGGAKARDIVMDQLDAAVAARGDIALVSVGGNDALRGVRVHDFESHLEQIAARLAEVTPIVVLSGVGDLGSIPRLPANFAAVARRRGRRFDAAHKRVATRTGVLVADQWEWAVERFGDPAIFCADLFHPGPEGHRVWAEVAWQTLAAELELVDS